MLAIYPIDLDIFNSEIIDFYWLLSQCWNPKLSHLYSRILVMSILICLDYKIATNKVTKIK